MYDDHLDVAAGGHLTVWGGAVVGPQFLEIDAGPRGLSFRYVCHILWICHECI